MNVKEAARAFRAAEENYHAAFRGYFTKEITPLTDDRFWRLQAVFVREVVTFRFGYARTNGIEQAARELFRKPLAGDFDCRGEGDAPSYSMHEAIQFAKTWRELARRLHSPLFSVVQDRGDDAYGDLLDALPLAGRELVQQSLDQEFGNHRQFEAAVATRCSDERLANLVLRGENYLSMSLVDAARRFFAICAGE